MLDLVYKQVCEQDYNFDTEDCQEIYIRKLFYTICLPFFAVKKHTVYNKNLGRKPVGQYYKTKGVIE